MAETKGMTSHERVLAAAKGKPVDRVPVMYWLNPYMGCRLMADCRPAPDRQADLIGRTLWERSVSHGEMDAGEWTRALPNLFIGYSNGHYLAELGSDAVFASIGSQKRLGRMLGMVRRKNGHLLVKDPLGCVRGVGGIYLDVIEPPVTSAAELASFELPELVSEVCVVRGGIPVGRLVSVPGRDVDPEPDPAFPAGVIPLAPARDPQPTSPNADSCSARELRPRHLIQTRAIVGAISREPLAPRNAAQSPVQPTQAVCPTGSFFLPVGSTTSPYLRRSGSPSPHADGSGRFPRPSRSATLPAS